MKHILIVDDSKEIRTLVGMYLDKLGFSYSKASNGLSGVEEVIRKIPDAIISDLEMPLMDGFDFLAKISTMKKSVPVIIITGKPQLSSEEVDRLQNQSSFRGILEKPFLLEDLKNKIEEIL
jgi:chemosensory pili system protein ChpA (sensor histidine kinase/response regulator)